VAITTLSSANSIRTPAVPRKPPARGRVHHRPRPARACAAINDEYQKITGKPQSIADLLAMPEAAEIELIHRAWATSSFNG